MKKRIPFWLLSLWLLGLGLDTALSSNTVQIQDGRSEYCDFYLHHEELLVGVTYRKQESKCHDAFELRLNGKPISSTSAKKWQIANWQAGKFSPEYGRPNEFAHTQETQLGINCLEVLNDQPDCLEEVHLWRPPGPMFPAHVFVVAAILMMMFGEFVLVVGRKVAASLAKK